MADDQDGVRIFLDIGFEPGRAFKVEIVGRLIEQQEIRLGEQDTGNRRAHTPAAGEFFRGAAKVFSGEAEAVQHFGGARFGGPGINVEQALMDFTDAVGVGRGLGFLHQGVALCVSGQHDVENGLVSGGDLLRDPAEPGAGIQADGAVIARVFHILADQAQQGGFARAVAAHKADFPAGRDLRRGRFKQGPGFDLKIEI